MQDQKELEGEGKYEDFVEYDVWSGRDDGDISSDGGADDDGDESDFDEDWKAGGDKKRRRKGGRVDTDEEAGSGDGSEDDEDDGDDETGNTPRVRKTKIVYYCIRSLPPHIADDFYMWDVLQPDFAFRTMQIGNDGMVVPPHEDHHHTAEKS